MWTKGQYESWLNTRGEAGSWKIEDCVNADAYVKHTALSNLKTILDRKGIAPVVGQFTMHMAGCFYGSVDVDDFLRKMEAYTGIKGLEGK